jgi:glycine/D-amino acid oxidase-like deaminating enzyme
LTEPDRFSTIVIGGGVYGCILATHLQRREAGRVLLLEREPELMRRASAINQARIHHGYHYPRSVLTALRSRVNYPRFLRDYEECVVRGGTSVYAIARAFSNVTASQFATFCGRIGAPLSPAPAGIAGLFDGQLIEAAFQVEECVFDVRALTERLARDLESAGVQVVPGADVRTLRAVAGGIEVLWDAPGGARSALAGHVLNCTYAGINRLLVASGCEALPLKHELTEMVVVDAPAELEGLAVTVMCGPFFSLLPFPMRDAHILSHVRYTPHSAWVEGPGAPCRDPDELLRRLPCRTAFPHMIQDARRYMPLLADCRYRQSCYEVKTVLAGSEADDSRPILMRESRSLPGLLTVMGSKIDNVYDALDSV